MDSAGNNSDSAFLDIATNLLAVLMIITVISMVTAQRASHSARDTQAVDEPTLKVNPRQRDRFPPFSQFYFVIDGRIAPLDLAPIGARLLADPETFTGAVALGHYRWLPEPITPRDIDTYQLQFSLDPAAVSAHIPEFSRASLADLIAELEAVYASERRAPVFIVYPSGMDVFAEIYPALSTAALRFRWFTRNRGATLLFARHPSQFTEFGTYW